MKLLLLTLDAKENGKSIQVAYEPWDDVLVYINAVDCVAVSPEWFIKKKPTERFFIDARKEGYGDFQAVVTVTDRIEPD